MAKKWNYSTASTTPALTTLTPSNIRIPTVFYTAEVHATIQYIVQKCEGEVGWVGTVKPLDNGDYLIDQIFIPPQTVHSTEADIKWEELQAIYIELMNNGDDPGRLCYWGHSHVNMGVTPSKTDEDTVGQWMEGCPVVLRGIYNKRGDAKVDIFDQPAKLVFQCVPNQVKLDLREGLFKELDEVLAANVKKNQPPTIIHSAGRGQHGTGMNIMGMNTSTSYVGLKRKACPPLQNSPAHVLVKQLDKNWLTGYFPQHVETYHDDLNVYEFSTGLIHSSALTYAQENQLIAILNQDAGATLGAIQ